MGVVNDIDDRQRRDLIAFANEKLEFFWLHRPMGAEAGLLIRLNALRDPVGRRGFVSIAKFQQPRPQWHRESGPENVCEQGDSPDFPAALNHAHLIPPKVREEDVPKGEKPSR